MAWPAGVGVRARHVLRLLDCSCRDLWSRCLTARNFGFVVLATVAVATLPPAAPSQASTDLSSQSLVPATSNPPEEPAPAVATGEPLPLDDALRSACFPSVNDRAVVSGCWGASCMRVEEAWRVVGPLAATLVAVLDTGVDIDSAGLAARIEDSIALVGAPGARDVSGHGTHIAGTIASIAPNCRLLNVKVADDRGFCESRCVADGIRLAANRGAAVINLSLEVAPSPELEAAVAYARDRGALVVAAAGMPQASLPSSSSRPDVLAAEDGEDGSGSCALVYPACYTSVLAVTGISEDGGIAPLSNRASWVDVAAPGQRTFSDMPGNTYGYLSGTSTAAAHVSGLAALLFGAAMDSNGNGLLNDEVRLAIESTARPMGIDGTGHGMVDAFAAVTQLAAW